MLAVWAKPLPPATNSQALAASTLQLPHHGQEVSRGTQCSDCIGRGAPRVFTWLSHRPGPFSQQPQSWCLLKPGQITEVHCLLTCRHIDTTVYRCNAKGSCLRLMTCLSNSPALLCTSAWAYCFSDHYMVVGVGRKGLLSRGDAQPVLLSTSYSPIHAQNTQLSITQCCIDRTQPFCPAFSWLKPHLLKNLPGFLC